MISPELEPPGLHHQGDEWLDEHPYLFRLEDERDHCVRSELCTHCPTDSLPCHALPGSEKECVPCIGPQHSICWHISVCWEYSQHYASLCREQLFLDSMVVKSTCYEKKCSTILQHPIWKINWINAKYCKSMNFVFLELMFSFLR